MTVSHAERRARKMKPCAQCGVEFYAPRERNLYCSRACVTDSQRAAAITCEICGAEFKRKRGSKNAGRCCSRACGFELQRRERAANKAIRDTPTEVWEWRSLVVYRSCVECAQLIPNRVGGQAKRVCGSRCAGRVRTRRLGGVPVGETVTSACDTCDQTFSYTRRGTNRTNCDGCRAVRARESAAKSKRAATAKARREGRYLGSDHRKRARHYGVEYEPIQPAYIYERDKWTCHLCGMKVKKSYSRTGYDPMGPTLDHIIPISKGGPHLKSNVALAHHICNTRKSDGAVGEQLLLVG